MGAASSSLPEHSKPGGPAAGDFGQAVQTRLAFFKDDEIAL